MAGRMARPSDRDLPASWHGFRAVTIDVILHANRPSASRIDKIEVLAPWRFPGNFAVPRLRNLKVAFSPALGQAPVSFFESNKAPQPSLVSREISEVQVFADSIQRDRLISMSNLPLGSFRIILSVPSSFVRRLSIVARGLLNCIVPEVLHTVFLGCKIPRDDFNIFTQTKIKEETKIRRREFLWVRITLRVIDSMHIILLESSEFRFFGCFLSTRSVSTFFPSVRTIFILLRDSLVVFQITLETLHVHFLSRNKTGPQCRRFLFFCFCAVARRFLYRRRSNWNFDVLNGCVRYVCH